MTTTTLTPALTAADLRTLRNADSVVFRFVTDRAPETTYGAPGTTVVCTKRHDPGDGFGCRELQVIIDLPTGSVTTYGRDDGPPTSQATMAWWVFTSAKFNPPLVTALAMLRPGDLLIPQWVANNNNGHVRDAGLTTDEFKLRVQRPTKSGRHKVFEFLLDSRVLPPHSTARDIRY
jgi:hypothetical protein